jgi:4-amino-4-deoxy-L-arabinose transferase-like glycosyltransferase
MARTAPASAVDRVKRKKSPEAPVMTHGTAVRDCSVIFACALGIRVVFFFQFRDTPFFFAHVSDSKIYIALAEAILRGGAPAKAWFMSPLYPHLLAALAWAGAAPETWMRLLQCLAGAAAAAAICALGRDIASPRAGLVAGLLAACFPALIFADNMLLLESSMTVLAVFHLLALRHGMRNNDLKLFIVAGALLGLLLVSRFSLVAWAVLLAVILLRDRRVARRGAAIALVLGMAAVVVAPWTIRNAVVEGVFVPVTSAAGYNLHAGNNAEARGWHHVPERVDIAADPNGHRFVERQLGRTLSSSEVSAYWREKAFRWIGEHPGDAFALLLRKAILFFHFSEIDQIGLSAAFIVKEYGTILALPLPTFAVLLFLSLVGAGMALRERLDVRIPALFFLAYFLSTIVFFVNCRLRVPVLPVLVLFAGIAVDGLLRLAHSSGLRRLGWKGAMQVALAPVAVFAALWLAMPRAVSSFEREYQTLADLAFKRADYPLASALFSRSLAERPTVFAAMGKANALAVGGDPARAERMFDSALVLDPENDLVWFNRGNFALAGKHPQDAYRYWRKAIALNPACAPAYRNIGLLLARTPRCEEALDALLRYRALESDPGQRAAIDRDIDAVRAMVLTRGK